MSCANTRTRRRARAERPARVLPREGVSVQRVDEDQVGLGRNGRIHLADVRKDVAPHKVQRSVSTDGRTNVGAKSWRSKVVSVPTPPLAKVPRSSAEEPHSAPTSRTRCGRSTRIARARRLDAPIWPLHTTPDEPFATPECAQPPQTRCVSRGEFGHECGVVRGERTGVRSIKRIQVVGARTASAGRTLRPRRMPTPRRGRPPWPPVAAAISSAGQRRRRRGGPARNAAAS